MLESTILKNIQISLSRIGCRLFRNNSGAVKTFDGRYIKYGVASPGGSDLIGILPLTVTPSMIGKTVGIFLAVEVKSSTGKRTTEQTNFLKMVNDNGGIGFIARSEQEAISTILSKTK